MRLNRTFMISQMLRFRCNGISNLLIIFLLAAGTVFNFGWMPSALAATDCSAVTEIPQAEYEALIAFYNGTDGPNWSDSATNKWNTNNLPSIWAGVTVSDGHVTNLIRYSKNLSGYLPAELGNLTNLEALDLYYNQLSGSVPPELGNLTILYSLYLDKNQLSGTIPSELGNLKYLRYLHLSGNQLSGLIPPELENLTKLASLNLGNNYVTEYF
ncbi:MAG: hypothetical protein GY749_36840 [Desulfobacteraceae bacterium]|nr:hypothetical protein [Desulfobacteraceae bacterium]